MANRRELQRVWQHVQEHPERHDQARWVNLHPRHCQLRDDAPRTPCHNPGDALDRYVIDDEWACGTTACFAGWTALLNGWRPIGPNHWVSVTDGVSIRDVDEVAAELLCLTLSESMALFYAEDRDEVARVVAELIDDTSG